MYCKYDGTKLSDDAEFCPICGRPTGASHKAGPRTDSMPPGGGYPGGGDNVRARDYLVRGIVGVAALILSIVAVVFLVRLVSTIEDTIKIFSTYDAVANGIGITCFILCGLLLTACAVMAALPVARFAIVGTDMGKAAIDRSAVFSIALGVICIAMWICKLIFHSPTGGSVPGVLYNIFRIFGETAMGCLVPVVIAVVLLYVARAKLNTPAGTRY